MADTKAEPVTEAHIKKYKALLDTKPTDKLEGWEPFYEGGGFKSWRKLKKGTELYKYRSLGVIPKCPPQKYFDFYRDLKHWKTWDTNVETLNIIESTSPNSEVIYWSVEFPFPLTNRDYVYSRFFKKYDDDFFMVFSKACTHPKQPPTSRVRVVDYSCIVAIGKTENGDTKLFLDSYDDPQLSIPAWVMTWLTGKALPAFLSTLVKECGSYNPK